MEAKELRLGNVCLRENFMVNKWDKEKFYQINVGCNDIVACVNSPQKFKPITLTEEWLVKMGFDYKIKSIHYRKWYIWDKDTQKGMDIFEEDEGYVFNGDTNIKHVHSLQNLYFALTNKELIIKND